MTLNTSPVNFNHCSTILTALPSLKLNSSGSSAWQSYCATNTFIERKIKHADHRYIDTYNIALKFPFLV